MRIRASFAELQDKRAKQHRLTALTLLVTFRFGESEQLPFSVTQLFFFLDPPPKRQILLHR